MFHRADNACVTILDTATRSQDQDDHMATLQPCDGHSRAEPQHAPIGHSHKITRPRRSHGHTTATDGHSHADKHNVLSLIRTHPRHTASTTTSFLYSTVTPCTVHSHSSIPQPLLAQSTVTPLFHSHSLHSCIAQQYTSLSRTAAQNSTFSRYHHDALRYISSYIRPMYLN